MRNPFLIAGYADGGDVNPYIPGEDSDLQNLSDYATHLQTTPEFSGSVLPITRYQDGHIGFDSNAGVLGGLKTVGNDIESLVRPIWGQGSSHYVNPDTGTYEFDPHYIAAATNLAGNMALGGAGSAATDAIANGIDNSVLGTFAGPGAKNFPQESLAAARTMLADAAAARNITPEQMLARANPRDPGLTGREIVRKATGIDLGHQDGVPRWEFPDNDAKLKQLDLGDGKGSQDLINASLGNKRYLYQLNGKNLTLSDVIDHPQYFDNYPDHANIPVFIDHNSTDSLYAPKNGSMSGIHIGVYGRNNEETLDSLLHEMTHAVQDKEGMALGSSPDTVGNQMLRQQMKDAGLPDPTLKSLLSATGEVGDRLRAFQRTPLTRKEQFDNYMRVPGEVEARTVPARKNLDWDGIRNTRLGESYPQGMLKLDPDVLNGTWGKNTATASSGPSNVSAMARDDRTGRPISMPSLNLGRQPDLGAGGGVGSGVGSDSVSRGVFGPAQSLAFMNKLQEYDPQDYLSQLQGMKPIEDRMPNRFSIDHPDLGPLSFSVGSSNSLRPETQFVRPSTDSVRKINGAYGSNINDAWWINGRLSDPNTFSTGMSSLPEELHGKGLGMSVYEGLIKALHDRDIGYASDKSLSTQSQPIYPALARRGYDVRANAVARDYFNTAPDVGVDPNEPNWLLAPGHIPAKNIYRVFTPEGHADGGSIESPFYAPNKKG